MPHQRTRHPTFEHSTQLRRSMTDAEQSLWRALRSHQIDGTHFRRQHAIGPYIVDFCTLRHKLVIELDGSQHLEQEAYDAQRTAFLEGKGFRVLRFWNHEVLKEPDAVIRVIEAALNSVEG